MQVILSHLAADPIVPPSKGVRVSIIRLAKALQAECLVIHRLAGGHSHPAPTPDTSSPGV
ncbi:hypothetical protein Pan216_51130 [Planctomycetes bacterium Pan216]|uniref:Uncharacterized protein n=1 Tax=Kolteria novifilia TaxID=2527975 RepID=A0A518BB62_9BACT|nr:hypothetical protein Pan216_51130 [Planctomycetes bacterium Pan216]